MSMPEIPEDILKDIEEHKRLVEETRQKESLEAAEATVVGPPPETLESIMARLLAQAQAAPDESDSYTEPTEEELRAEAIMRRNRRKAKWAECIDGWDSDHHPEAKAARIAAGTYAKRLMDFYESRNGSECSPSWLSLLGPSGVGKTRLATAIGAFKRDLRSQPQPVKWSGQGIYSRLAKGDWDLIDQLQSQDLLIIDDMSLPISEESMSPMDRKYIKAISGLLDHRLGKWTVITDNRTLEQLMDIEARIASRMRRGENVVFEFRECQDYCISES